MKIPMRSVEVVAEKMCGFFTEVVRKCGSEINFNKALRLMLIDPKCYENLPANFIDGLLLIITIPCCETIAETQGSSI